MTIIGYSMVDEGLESQVLTLHFADFGFAESGCHSWLYTLTSTVPAPPAISISGNSH